MVRRVFKESFSLLARYGEALKISNPSTQSKLETKVDDHFKYMYMTLGVAVRGFFELHFDQ